MVQHRRRSVLLSHLEPWHPGSAHASIVDELRRVILGGGVPPGTPIPLNEVAQALGVSHIPVREALMTLIGEGLVDHRPNSGYTVAELTRAELTEMYLIRGVLERTALRNAVGRVEASHRTAAIAAHDALDRAIAAGDLRAYHRESRRFHMALVEPCRMHRLLAMFAASWNVTEPWQPMARVGAEQRARLHADHRDLLRAFLQEDGETLLAIATEHHARLEEAVAGLPLGEP
jgi:DNA-binding GntR family transcriptional regulator